MYCATKVLKYRTTMALTAYWKKKYLKTADAITRVPSKKTQVFQNI